MNFLYQCSGIHSCSTFSCVHELYECSELHAFPNGQDVYTLRYFRMMNTAVSVTCMGKMKME